MKYNLLSFLCGVLLLAIILFVKNDNNDENAIKVIKIQNDSLLIANSKLDSINKNLMVLINKGNNEILELTQRDKKLKDRVNYLNSNIKMLNIKYEKAITYSNGFESIEIARYFSNL